MRSNLIQMSKCVRTAREGGKVGMPTLHGLFSQALLGDLARLSPHPAMLALAARLIGEQRSWERMVGLALAAGTQFVTIPQGGLARRASCHQRVQP